MQKSYDGMLATGLGNLRRFLEEKNEMIEELYTGNSRGDA